MKMFFYIWLILTFSGPLWLAFSGKVDFKADYRTANRDSAKIAPLPEEHPDAVIQFYAARAFNWRGMFGSHCWMAVKPKDAPSYTVYQVVGWLTYYGKPALSIMQDIPDRNWFNEKPHLILDVRGGKAEALIPKVEKAIKSYPYAEPYTLWPGPNSNTLPAYVGRKVPELELVMPADAVGKDFLSTSEFFAPAPSGTGYQFSLFGLFGITIARKEGIEINVLGMTYGIRLSPFRILLPGLS